MKRHVQLFICLLILVALASAALSADRVSQNAAGEQRVLVIMARFPGIEPSVSIEQMRGKYFDKLDRYLRAVSYGKTWVTGKMTDWYTLPRPVSEYQISQHNLGVDKARVMKLVQDAVNLADRNEDFSQYSMIFISLGVDRAEYGMMGLCGYPGMLGWQSQLPIATKGKRQRIPGGVAIYCERAHVGVVFHDMAHIMGGVQGSRRVLPCLYDHDLQGQPGPFRDYAQFYMIHLGYFDPMSCHMFEPDQGPPGPCAWTKRRLNWIEPQKVVKVAKGESKTLLLGPLSEGSSGTLAVKLSLSATTYYLIENRQPIGPDRNLPSHGVLISYCDDEIAECRHGESPVKLVIANPSIPELKGAPFTPQGKNAYVDEKRGISIKVIAQRGKDCEIQVTRGR